MSRSRIGYRPPAVSLDRSIELEYWVVDERGRLAGAAELVGAAPGVEQEFVEPLLEVKTPPCSRSEPLRTVLFDRIEAVLERAEDVGRRLVPLSTPLAESEIEDVPSERTQIQADVVGENFRYVRHCAGTHVHIEQCPGERLAQLNTLVGLDPAFALVNSSPYFGHEPVAPGARSLLYRNRGYEGIPEQGQLWPYADSVEEWNERLERRYTEFVERAVEAGFDRALVESQYGPDTTAWTPVRLRRQFPTVEWRSPDTTLPSQALRLSETLTRLVHHATETEVRVGAERGGVSPSAVFLPTFETVSGYVDDAIHEGLNESLCSYLGRMGFDVGEYDPLAQERSGDGELSERQAREYRLEAARQLEHDVRRTPISP